MIRIGILGTPESITEHVRLLRELNGFEIIGYHPVHDSLMPDASPLSGAARFESALDLVKMADAVDIANPSPLLYPFVTDAIRQTKHVLIRNPFTDRSENIAGFSKLLTEARGIIQITQPNRYNPAIMAAMPYIRHPRYIEYRRTVPFDHRQKHTSLIMNYMLNDIDLALFITRSSIRRLSISGVRLVSDYPDLVEARIDFANGSVANFLVNRVTTQASHTCEFFREGNRTCVDLLHQTANIYHINLNSTGRPFPYPEITTEPLLITPVDPLQEELVCFQTSINQKKYPQANVDDALNALTIALELQEKLDRLCK